MRPQDQRVYPLLALKAFTIQHRWHPACSTEGPEPEAEDPQVLGAVCVFASKMQCIHCAATEPCRVLSKPLLNFALIIFRVSASGAFD